MRHPVDWPAGVLQPCSFQHLSSGERRGSLSIRRTRRRIGPGRRRKSAEVWCGSLTCNIGSSPLLDMNHTLDWPTRTIGEIASVGSIGMTPLRPIAHVRCHGRYRHLDRTGINRCSRRFSGVLRQCERNSNCHASHLNLHGGPYSC